MRRAPPDKRFRAAPAASRRAPRVTAAGLCGFVLAVSLVLAGCGREPPPRTVAEYLDDPTLLDATLGRCNRLPAGGRGEPDCDNARRAAQRLAAEAEALQREQRRAREDAEAQPRERADERSDEWERRRDSVRPSTDAPLQPVPGDSPPPARAEPPPPSRTGPAPPAETQGNEGAGGSD